MSETIAGATPEVFDKQQIVGFFSSLPPQSLAQIAFILQRMPADRLSYLSSALQSELDAAHEATVDQLKYAQENMASQAQLAKEALATAQAYHENLRKIPRKVEAGLD